MPWLVARAISRPQPETPGGKPVFVLLPNLTTPEERRNLRDVLLEAPLVEGTWIRPEPEDMLRAGDAAVFLPKHLRARPAR